jgi:hypothetical protein
MAARSTSCYTGEPGECAIYDLPLVDAVFPSGLQLANASFTVRHLLIAEFWVHPQVPSRVRGGGVVSLARRVGRG